MIGDEIRQARLTAGLSQEELAFRAKLSRNYISLVELNQNSPTLDTLVRLCQALDVRAATLVGRHERAVSRGVPSADAFGSREPSKRAAGSPSRPRPA